MADYGFGPLALASGAQEGLDTLLKRKLMEREMALREQAQSQQAQFQQQSLAAQQADRQATQEQTKAYRDAMLANTTADNERQDATANFERAKFRASTMPKGAPLGDESVNLFRATGMGHLAKPKPMEIEGPDTALPVMGAEFAGLPEKEQAGFKEVGPVMVGGRRVLQLVDPNDPNKILAQRDAPPPASQSGGSGTPYYSPWISTLPGSTTPVLGRFDHRTGGYEVVKDPVTGAGVQPRMQQGELLKANEYAAANNSLTIIKREYFPSPDTPRRDIIGPAVGRWNAVIAKTPDVGGTSMGKAMGLEGATKLPPRWGEFSTAVANFKNQTIKAITGAQMSEAESARLQEQIPLVTDRPEVFEAKLAIAEEIAAFAFQRWSRAESLKSAGLTDPSRLQSALDAEMPVPQHLLGVERRFTIQR